MPSANEIVTSSFAQANIYAQNAQEALTGFTNALNGALYTPPTMSLNWTSISAPVVPTVNPLPDLPTVAFNLPSGQPTALTDTMPAIVIDDFSVTDPALTFPTAPTMSIGTTPTIPAVGTVSVPDAPTITTPDAPTYLSLSTVTFSGIDIHADWLTQLGNIPTLTLASPTPYSYVAGPEYASTLLTSLKAVINTRLAGGTGLAPAVEQAIWDRARSRETQNSLANEQEIMRASEALGFQLPAGVLAAQLRDAQQDYYDKLSGLSRDIGIKQAELEQENLKSAISQGIELEGRLIDYSYRLEQLTFETAKAYAENAIQIYNASVEGFKALLSGYQTYAGAYKTIIDAELAKVEVYKAELSGEETKAKINEALVQQYKAQIEASMSQVEIYKAQVNAAQTLVELEKAKIGAAGEQIKAYVAQVNAETAKVEAYKSGVQAEASKVDVFRAQTQAFSAKVGAQAEKARVEIARYSALTQSKSLEWDGWKAKISGETARVQALGTQSNALLDGYKAGASATEAQGTLNARVWESNIKQYEAGQQLAIQTAKINGEFAIQTNNARLDAAKAGAQVYAQLTSSAYSMIHASAGVSSSAGLSVGYSYSNDTTSTAPTYTGT